MAWAVEQKTGSPTRKAVLLSLANCANHQTGLCCPSIEAICAETEFGRSAVKNALAELVELGYIARDRQRRADGTQGTYVYSFPSQQPGSADGQPGSGDDPSPGSAADPHNQEYTSNQETVECVEEPTTKLFVVHPLTEKFPVDTPHAREPRWKVDRKPVSDQEHDLAKRVLGEWNAQTGQTLCSRDWLAKIVLRIREHPELGFAEHTHAITCTLSEPWWHGPASPSVVYGNGAQFERCLTLARSGPSMLRRDGGLTPAGILALGRRMDELRTGIEAR